MSHKASKIIEIISTNRRAKFFPIRNSKQTDKNTCALGLLLLRRPPPPATFAIMLHPRFGARGPSVVYRESRNFRGGAHAPGQASLIRDLAAIFKRTRKPTNPECASGTLR
jgi:hypothetical protein